MAQASAEKLEHTGPAEKEWPQCHRESNWQVCQIMGGGRESRWARAASWRERGRSEQEHKKQRVDSTVNEGRFQGGKGGQARRASLEEVEGSMSG